MTPRQQEVLDYIVKHITEKGYAPTIREIGAGVNLKSSSTVNGHIKRLIKLGAITQKPDSPRSIVIVNPVKQKTEESLVTVITRKKGKVTTLRFEGRVFTYFPSKN